jgi:NADH:ubiquinone oxidoreductase subunit 6 (subunit J)
MTNREKIGWLLVAPFLSVLVAGIIFGSYMVIAEAPWWVTVGLAGLFSAIAGLFVLTDDEEDIY